MESTLQVKVVKNNEQRFQERRQPQKKQTPSSWRRPKGGHSRARLQKKGANPLPKVGYRTSKEARGKHPSGYEEVLVHNADELEKIDPETEAARIGGKVGGRKRHRQYLIKLTTMKIFTY